VTFITREEWGAREPDMSKIGSRSLSDITTAIVHYADAIPPHDPAGVGYNIEEPDAQTVRAIQNYHMDTQQWGDIAYNRLIAPDGEVFEGRKLEWVPAATYGANGNSVAYCVLTNGPITDAAKAALVAQLHADCAPRGVFYQRVAVHKDFDPTACPGDVITAWVHDGYPVTPTPPTPTPTPDVPCNELPPGPPPPGVPFLAEGSSGPDVARLQGLLAAHGFTPVNSLRPDHTWDGIFGPGTASAVASLQHHAGLLVDGKVGRQTWCALGVK
jgi:Putative peptidoglycan binding domain/N-acetylmuramoyl-L-alanine amidase